MSTTAFRSIRTTYAEDVAYVLIVTQPDGTWDCSERFEQEWNDMVRELYRAGYEPPSDEPSTALGMPGVGECEVYVCSPMCQSEGEAV